MLAPTHDPAPVIGYNDGLIRATSSPERLTVNGNPNDWFTIDGKRYNVHPYRADFGGYPVRWIESTVFGDNNDTS